MSGQTGVILMRFCFAILLSVGFQLAQAEGSRTDVVDKAYPTHKESETPLPSNVLENLRSFIREHELSTNPDALRNVQRKSSRQTVVHFIPYVNPPEWIPQSFIRIANISNLDETIELLLADGAGNVEWSVEIDLFAGETRHVNSDDIAGLTTKGGIRVDYFGSDVRAAKSYVAVGETSNDIFMRSFTRSADGFINDVGTVQQPFQTPDGRSATVLGTANPGSNRAVVGWLRYINLDTSVDSISIDLFAYDDSGRASRTVACRIPKLGALMLEIDVLERAGNHPWCTGTWGDGKGKWEVHSRSDSVHLAMSFLYSAQLGILANVSTADVFRAEN